MTADIVITEFMDAAAVADLTADFDVIFDPGLVDDRDRLLALVGSARAVIVRNRTRVDRELLDAAPGLIAVGRLGVGLDNIDLEACASRGVEVHPAVGANAAAVAEYVIGAILVLFRGVFNATTDVVAGRWPRADLSGREVSGKRLALVGFGGIARILAAKAAALGMVVAAYDPFVAPEDPAWTAVERTASLDELLEGADVASVHVPLVPETRHLISAEQLGLLAPHGVVINTSRGGIVDEAAVVDALRSGRLGGAALDVFAAEPVDARGGAQFAGVQNLILTPHIAGITEESNERVSGLTAANVRRSLSEARR